MFLMHVDTTNALSMAYMTDICNLISYNCIIKPIYIWFIFFLRIIKNLSTSKDLTD